MPMFDGYLDSQVALIRSQRVIDLAMHNPDWKALTRGLMPEQVVEFSESLLAEHPSGSELVIVSFMDTDPEAARRGVAAVIDAYDRLYGENDSQGAQARLKLLEERRASLAAEHKRLEEQVRELVGMAATGTLEQIYGSKLQTMLRLETQLGEVELSLTMAGEPRAANQPVRERPTSIEALAMQFPEVARLLAIRREVERQLSVDRKQFGEKHRAISDGQVKLEVLTKEL